MSQATSSNDRATNANLHSITLMIAAMGCFTIADLLIKIASQTMPVGQAMLVLGLGSTVVFLILMRMKKEPVLLAPLVQPVLTSALDSVGSDLRSWFSQVRPAPRALCQSCRSITKPSQASPAAQADMCMGR